MPTGRGEPLDLHTAQRAEPKYARLKNHLLVELKQGRLKPGEALPTEVELAGRLRIARSTVRQALGELDREGLIQRVRGKGTFIHRDVHRRLRRGLNVFGLVMPKTQTGQYPALQHGFERAAARAEHQVIVSSTDNDVSRQADVILQLLEKEVAGVAMVPTTAPTPVHQILALRKQGIPVVFCHRRVDGIAAPLLALPFHEVGRMAGEALLRHGHRRVAMFLTRRDRWALAYLESMREALRKGGGDAPDEFVHFGSESPTDVKLDERAAGEAVRKMFSRPDRPTGIMCGFDSVAETLYLLLGRLGLRVPEDVSLVGFGGRDRRGAILQRLASVVIDGAETGRRAGELLSEMCDGIRAIDDDDEIVMRIGFSAGETLGPAASDGQGGVSFAVK
jgi:DNA-binding LacI/PurR family transcriptional regulator